MSRMERRMYKHRRGQALLRKALLFLTALIVVAGLASRLDGRERITTEPVIAPTPTPLTAAFDETIEQRELTLPEETWYTLQTGIFAEAAAAERKAEAYTERGAPGYVLQDGDKHRVLIAGFGEREDAASVRQRLAEQQQVETYIHRWTKPALTLRISGMIGQLDVAEAGFALIDQTAAQLRDDARRLDAGELTAEEALQRVAEMQEQCTLWAKTAKERFATPYPALIEGELSFCDSFAGAVATLRQSGSATVLSGEMKKQAMALYTKTIDLRNRLAETD